MSLRDTGRRRASTDSVGSGPHLDLEPVLDGYAMTSDSPDRRQLDLHTLYTAMPSLAIGVAENDDAGVRRVSTLLRSLLVAL